MIPRKIHLDKSAVMIELKWDKSAEGAIKRRKNIAVLSKNGICKIV